MANIRYDSSGSPVINSASDYLAYQAAKDKLTKIYQLDNVDSTVFWCQTGGWFSDSNGSTECGRTSVATMVSINSESVVKPNDVSSMVTEVNVNGEAYQRKNSYEYFADAASQPQNGLTNYDLDSEEELLNAVNNELASGRSVVVHTTFTKSTGVQSEHWVTVTGTKTGYAATSFNDLIGIDPWFNGGNDFLGQSGSGSASNDEARSGVVSLNSTLNNQELNSDYRIFTFVN
jgi:hypothetical protein